MVSTQLQELAQRAQMRQVSGGGSDWAAVRSALGFDVPADYKELIDNFGAGLFNYYVQIFGPDEPQRPFNIKESGLYWDGIFRTDWAQRPDAVPSRLQGRDIAIINWGSTEDAVQFFWIADSEVSSKQWEVAFHSMEGNSWEFYKESTVEVLLSFVKGELPSSLLEPYGPEESITFTPYP